MQIYTCFLFFLINFSIKYSNLPRLSFYKNKHKVLQQRNAYFGDSLKMKTTLKPLQGSHILVVAKIWQNEVKSTNQERLFKIKRSGKVKKKKKKIQQVVKN